MKMHCLEIFHAFLYFVVVKFLFVKEYEATQIFWCLINSLSFFFKENIYILLHVIYMYIVASYVTSQNSFFQMIQHKTNIPSITLS